MDGRGFCHACLEGRRDGDKLSKDRMTYIFIRRNILKQQSRLRGGGLSHIFTFSQLLPRNNLFKRCDIIASDYVIAMVNSAFTAKHVWGKWAIFYLAKKACIWREGLCVWFNWSSNFGRYFYNQRRQAYLMATSVGIETYSTPMQYAAWIRISIT